MSHKIRPIELEADYALLQSWWDGHRTMHVPKMFLPQGYILCAGGVDVVAAFLYMDAGGKLALIQYLTTNPGIAFSRFLVDDARKLVGHIEQVAKVGGCLGIISLVAPNTGHSRLMKRLNYIAPGENDPAHIMFAKTLTEG